MLYKEDNEYSRQLLNSGKMIWQITHQLFQTQKMLGLEMALTGKDII